MSLDGIRVDVVTTGVEQLANVESNTTKSSSFGIFKDNNGNSVWGNHNNDNDSDAKIITENFKNEIMSNLDTSKSNKSPQTIKYYLGKLVEVAQELNGVQKNNLKPNGTPKQNKIYNRRIEEMMVQMKDYAEYVGSGLSVIQDSKTDLYKFRIDNKIFDIPERKVEIVNQKTEEGIELMPEIVD